MRFSKNKDAVFLNIFAIYFLSFFSFFVFRDNYGVFTFFFPCNSFDWLWIEWINYYQGFSFLPFCLVSFISFLRCEDYLSLYFFHMFTFDLLMGALGYGSGISSILYHRLGVRSLILIFVLCEIFSWFFYLYLVLEFDRGERFSQVKSKPLHKSRSDVDSVKRVHLPGIELLSIGKKIDIKINIEEQKELLVRTLAEFGVEAKIVEVFIGPVVTLFSIELAPGIKAVRVINLSEDIARSMEAFSVRISSIPGKNLLGVEIANAKRQMVYFKEGISSEVYSNFEGNLPLYLGCNIYGEHEVFDLSTMPHLLVAGTTGSGKSVGIHTMLLSLLYQRSYEEFKLILIDPKKLELTPYEDIPYLLFPVVTEAKDAIRAVKWAVHEMESRYKAMSKIGVRNITSYNLKIQDLNSDMPIDERYERFSYIVVVIDEMADLMLLAGKEFEIYVQRLAQMGRAAGLHMIIATQRPSVDVITGTIKANFPTRISFKLSTKLDSRTILGDMSGAEQLLGSGDMLYLGNNGKLKRIHGSFVSEEDVLLVVDFLKSQGAPQYIDLDFDSVETGDSVGTLGLTVEEDDALYDEAVSLIRAEKKVSTSFLQRCFPIGYNRAAKLIERMEKEGVITKGDKFGRNREIL